MPLTTRQRSVLFGLAAGLSYEEIADLMHVKLATVGFHRQKLATAVHVESGNTVMLLRAAVGLGYLPADVLGKSVKLLLGKVV